MNCKNCNAELPEAAEFCPVCGERCDSAGEPAEQEQKVPKKGKRIAAIIAAVVVVLAAGIGVTAHAQISNFVRRSFSSPESYYQYVEKKNRDESSKTITNYYDAMTEGIAAPENKNVSYKLELGQSLKTMLSMTGMDFSALNNAELNVNGKVDEDIVSAQVKGRLNDADAITLNMYVDYAKKEGFFQIPELSGKYVDFSKLLQDEEMEEMFSSLTMMRDYFPETEQVETIIQTYSDLFINEMDTVEKSSADLEAAGVTAGYTDLKVSCKGKKLYDILLKIMTTMKDDQTIKAFIEKASEDAYAEFTSSIEEGIEQLKEQESEVTDEDVELVMDVFVDSEGIIAGRVLNITDNENTLSITCASPEKGSEIGTTFSVDYNEVNYFTLSGKGTRKGGKVSGEYTVSMDDSLMPSDSIISSMKDILTIKVTDLDEDTLEDGTLNGSFSLSTKAIASFTSYELQLDCKGDKDQTTQALSVVCGGDKLATLTASSQEGTETQVTKPGEGSEICDASDEAAMDAYVSELNPEELLASIKEKCGVDLSTYMTMFENLFGGSDDPDYDIEDDYVDGDLGYDLQDEDGDTGM